MKKLKNTLKLFYFLLLLLLQQKKKKKKKNFNFLLFYNKINKKYFKKTGKKKF